MLFCKPQHRAIDGEAESRDQSPTSRASGQNRVEPGPERNERPHPPPHRDRPRIWLDQPIKHLQQRRLPRPVMPNQPQTFPPAQLEADILDGEEFAGTETGRGVERRGSRGACRRCNG